MFEHKSVTIKNPHPAFHVKILYYANLLLHSATYHS